MLAVNSSMVAVYRGGGGLYRAEIFVHNLFGVFKICRGIRWAVPLLTCTMREDLVNYS